MRLSSPLPSPYASSRSACALLAALAAVASAAPGPADAALGGCAYLRDLVKAGLTLFGSGSPFNTRSLSSACAGNAISELKSSKLANCVNLIGLFQLATLGPAESVVPPLKACLFASFCLRLQD